PVREVGPGNPILSDSTGEPPPSTFNYAWDIAFLPDPCCKVDRSGVVLKPVVRVVEFCIH
ncbi:MULTISPECIES: hypothetical protein, partial [unclassified Burkholderia]